MANQEDQKLVKLVNRFRGISQYKNIAADGMDSATDLLNVMPSNIGNLEKLRVPIVRGPQASGQSRIDSIFYFSQGAGTRQIFVNAGSFIGYYTDPETGALWAYAQIGGSNVSYIGRMHYVSSNNLLLFANGSTLFKWNGVAQTSFGATQAPTISLGVTLPILGIQRSAGAVITITFDISGVGTGGSNGINSGQFGANLAPAVGDTVKIAGVVGDATFNGNWAVVTNPGGGVAVTLTGNGGASGPFVNQGNITVYGCPCGPFNITNVSRGNNVTTISFVNNVTMAVGDQIVIAALPGPYTAMNGTWVISASAIGGVSFNQIGPDVFAAVPGAGTITGGFSNAVAPRTWRAGWADTVLGHEGPSSNAPSISLPNNAGLVSNYRAYLTITPPPTLNGYPQGINGVFLYANQDGGGVWVLHRNDGIAYSATPNIGGNIVIGDGRADATFDASQQANFINFPPPSDMKFMVKWQGRIFGGGMLSAPQDCVFSGYDQILRGRPEQSFPPLNRLRLAIGADTLRGFGVLMNGVCLWDQSNKMYLFEGTIEDIVATQPTLLTAFLADEPWQVGLSSIDSVQSTPRGVIWVAADLTVQIWNGIFYGELIGPRDLSVNIYPLMKRITVSTKALIQSAFFNWLDRDWYAILVCLDGATTPTNLIFFDLSQEGADNLGVWITNVQADAICVKEDSTGLRRLIITQGGAPYELMVGSTSVSGVHTAPTATSASMSAYWSSGYWQDSPHMTKMYRYGRLTTDQDGFNLITSVLNDETSRLRDANPYSANLSLTPGGRFAVNRKGRRVKFDILFPTQDVDASVLELYVTAIPLSEI